MTDLERHLHKMPSRYTDPDASSQRANLLTLTDFFAARDIKLRIVIIVLALTSLEVLFAQSGLGSSPTVSTHPQHSSTFDEVETCKLCFEHMSALTRHNPAH